MKTFDPKNTNLSSSPLLQLDPLSDGFTTKRLDLLEPIKIGRKVSPKAGPEPNNGIFDSKVLSRTHAEVFSDHGKVKKYPLLYYFFSFLFFNLIILEIHFSNH